RLRVFRIGFQSAIDDLRWLTFEAPASGHARDKRILSQKIGILRVQLGGFCISVHRFAVLFHRAVRTGEHGPALRVVGIRLETLREFRDVFFDLRLRSLWRCFCGGAWWRTNGSWIRDPFWLANFQVKD